MKELDVVRLTRAFKRLPVGSIGTIVHDYIAGEFFIVEFCDDNGATVALEDLTCRDLQVVWVSNS